MCVLCLLFYCLKVLFSLGPMNCVFVKVPVSNLVVAVLLNNKLLPLK